MKSSLISTLAAIVLMLHESTTYNRQLIVSPSVFRADSIIHSSSPEIFRVRLLGTAVGPRIDLQRFGAAILIEVGDERLLFDCGRGATLRMAQMGISHGSISRVFLTHLHSDHVIQLPDLLLTGWVGGGRNVPLQVWGPKGTTEMMNHLLKAFAFDIHMRRDVDEKVPGDGINVLTHEIKQGIVFEDKGIKVTAFVVDHSPVKPAFGYASIIVVILWYYQEIHVFLQI